MTVTTGDLLRGNGTGAFIADGLITFDGSTFSVTGIGNFSGDMLSANVFTGNVSAVVLKQAGTGAHTVTTSPVTLYTATQVNSTDVAIWLYVCGVKSGDATVQFLDLVGFFTNGSTPFVYGGSSLPPFKGAPDTRTYTISGLALQVTMGANTYHLFALPVVVGTPGA